MRLCHLLIAALVLAVPGAVRAQDGGTSDAGTADYNTCIDTTGRDSQPNFNADAGGYNAVLLTNDTPPALRLNTNNIILDPERIILPFEQDLEALIVDDQAGDGASHTLGWFYYQDLIDRGYVDTHGTDTTDDDTLIDADNSGVPDFHEDLYNLNPARPYIGVSPRCPAKPYFTHTKPDNTTIQLREPELLTGACNEPSTYTATGGPRRWPDGDTLYPPRPGGAAVGRAVQWADLAYPNTNRTLTISSDGSAYTKTDTWFSDQGLFPHIPNLLEPKDPKNGNKGLGYLALLATDDDANKCPNSATSECLQPRMVWSTDGGTQVGPIWDKSGAYDGIPDYKASAIDNTGHVIPGKNANAAPNEEDRRVKIGRIKGNKEIVFFLVTYVEQIYGRMNGTDSTDSCFITKPIGGGLVQCQLWAHGDINVFFSKTFLNMDLHQTGGTIVATKELQSGWLNNGAYARLQSDTYGRVFFQNPQNKNVISYGQRAAHTIVGAPANNPRVWILGWEDQNSGGNRTYNDIVILINKQNNGIYKSEIVSDIDLSVARDYTITSVTLTVKDNPFFDPNGNSGACTPSITQPDGSIFKPRPKITYQVALDCKVCVSDCNTTHPVFERNPAEPQWVTVPFTDPTAPPGQRNNVTVSIDNLLDRGYTGTQLCWRAIMESPGEGCQPTIYNVDISYKAQKSGQYARSSRIRVANTALYGMSEVPGRGWVENANLTPSTRLKDGMPDMSPRGHLYLKKLYEPEDQNTLLSDDNAVNAPLWDGGEVQRIAIKTGNPNDRKLYTRVAGVRAEVKDSTATALLFPTSGADNLCGNVPRYDLDNDGVCNATDRTVLKDWLYGWEQASTVRRTWPMGAINLSTPALVGVVTEPAWLANPGVTETEKTQFRTRFKDAPALAGRRSVAFVGTNQGFLHAVDVGKWNSKNDPCTTATEYSGHFELANEPACTGARQYGTGEELFAYLPGKMLLNYVETYLRTPRADRPPATMEASPTFASVDLGQNDSPDSTGANDYNAKTGYVPKADTAWKLSTDPKKLTGAKTVLASGAGPYMSVFYALDVTDPTKAEYPWPLWEYDLNNEYYHTNDNSNVPCTSRTAHGDCASISDIFNSTTIKPDTRGSRHNPLLVRMDFGSRGGKKWVAAFTTDFTPRPGTAGTLYLMDVKTGQPVMVNHGSGMKQRLAGVVTLGTDPAKDHDQGIGGSPAAVDVDGDGSYDVIYVPSTSGKVYKVNLRDVDATRAYGKAISSCVIADAQTAKYTNNNTVADASSQHIYTNLVLRTTRSGTNATVDIFFGTGNNPDTDTDPDDLAASPRTYHIMAFRDSAPLTASCTVQQQWVQPLAPGQSVWGGLVMREDAVTTATAVGTRADACSVSNSDSGIVYAFNRNTGTPTLDNGTPLGGHGFSPPFVIGKRVIYPNVPNPPPPGPGNMDPPTGSAGNNTSRVLLWDVRPDGNIREVIP